MQCCTMFKIQLLNAPHSEQRYLTLATRTGYSHGHSEHVRHPEYRRQVSRQPPRVSPRSGIFLERTKIFFATNDIPLEKKVPVFLNAIGSTAYEILRNLFAPENPLDKSLKDVTDKLSEHYDPKPLTIVERYHFHKRDQAAEESLAEYVVELRRLAARCEFGDHLDDALCDRFVEEEPQDEDVDDYVEKVISSVKIVGVQGTVKPYKTMLEMNGQRITMEIDTGAVVSLISQETQMALFPGAALEKPALKRLTVVGLMKVTSQI